MSNLVESVQRDGASVQLHHPTICQGHPTLNEPRAYGALVQLLHLFVSHFLRFYLAVGLRSAEGAVCTITPLCIAEIPIHATAAGYATSKKTVTRCVALLFRSKLKFRSKAKIPTLQNGKSSMKPASCFSGVNVKLASFFVACFLSSNAYSARTYCIAEIEAYEKTNLTEKERGRLNHMKRLNTDLGFYPVSMDLVRAHLDSFDPTALQGDTSPVSACLLREIASAYPQDKTFTGYALEGYALRLLNGSGVKRDLAQAEHYLERAALEGQNGSAAYRLAAIQLEGSPPVARRNSGISWAAMALKYAATTPGGSEDPRKAIPLLRKEVEKSMAKQDFKTATIIYQEILRLNLENAPQDIVSANFPQIRKAIAPDAPATSANSSTRTTDWGECFERVTGYREKYASEYMTEEAGESVRSGRRVMRSLVKAKCGER